MMNDNSLLMHDSGAEIPAAENESSGVTVSWETLLVVLAVVVALVLRLAALGRLPLSEHEAAYAWQAYQVSLGEPVTLLSHPAYVLLTGSLFYLLGSGDVLARLLPAVIGSAVIVLPLAFRRQLGQKAALVAAFGLAVDPLLVAYSRQAGSPAMALGFAALVVMCWQGRKPLAAGLFTALYLLSGPSAVLGLLVTLTAGIALYFANRRQGPTEVFDFIKSGRFLAGFGAALAAFGTLFLRYPQGAAAMLQAFPDYFTTWGGPVSIPLFRSMAALPVYTPLALIFGFIAFSSLDVWLKERTRPFAWWLLAALIFALVNPGRQVSDLLWGIVPLWLLAAPVIAQYLHKPEKEDRAIVWVGMIFVLVLLFYWLSNLAMMTQQYVVFPAEFNFRQINVLDPGVKTYLVRVIIALFIPLLVVLLAGVVQYSWPGDVAFQSVTWGAGIFLLFYLVMTVFGYTDDRTEIAGELWVQGSSPGYVEEIKQAVEEASLQISGAQTEVDLVYTLDSALLHWTFRDFPNARYQTVIGQDNLPSMIVNADFTFGDREQGRFYRGQRAVLSYRQAWGTAALPPDLDRWLMYRVSPLEPESIAIWTRADLFPLYTPPTEAAPLPDAAN